MSADPGNSSASRRLRRRLLVNVVFSRIGLAFSLSGLVFIAVLLYSLTSVGYRAFYQAFVDIRISPQAIEAITADGAGAEEGFVRIRNEMADFLLHSLKIDDAQSAAAKEALALISNHSVFYAYQRLIDDPQRYADKPLLIPASSAVDQYLKDQADEGANGNILSPSQIGHIDALLEAGILQQRFSTIFLSHSDSRLPEMAGIFGALMGSIYTLLVTFALAIPLGIASAVYLQEFAAQSRLVRLIEVNINNLAAVPSIIFGLFGLGVFINLLGMPRSVPLVGGFVLALMTFPTIVIASRQALVAVPASLREGALAVGATRHQMVFHHVVPYALPSMMTGSIIGMAQALGETAPLLMLGMVAFIASAPTGVLDPATTLPVQIYLWSDSPERGIVDKTVGAILVLIVFLIIMNAAAVYLRVRFERGRRL